MGITINDAIDRYSHNAEYERTHGNLQGCLEFRQLAEWLKEYKRLKEQEPCEAKKMYNKGFADGLKSLYEHLKLCQEEQEPCEDCVSREELKKWLDMNFSFGGTERKLELFDRLDKELPSVKPKEPKQEPKTEGWIPVSERLPEEGQWVMVTFGGKIAVCLAQDNGGTLREVTSLISKNATKIWLFPEPVFGDGYAVWMPLPEPYKGER